MKGIMVFIVPDEILQEFTQCIRDFDTTHPDCAFNMFGETAKNSEQMRKIFEQVKPGFPFVGEWKLKDEK